MNNQNILKYYGTKLDVRLDSSEYYDFEISKTENDFNYDLLDTTTPIVYDTLIIDGSLSGFTSNRTTISLNEYDYSSISTAYTYSGLTLVLDYDDFTEHFDTTGYTFSNIILNNNIFTYTGITGNTHYFQITGFNDTEYVTPLLTGFTVGEIISGFSQTVISCLEKITDTNECCLIPEKLNNKPWAYQFLDNTVTGTCDSIIERRTENGWTIDFVFNRESQSWSDGNVFYYFGVRGDDDEKNYADNNLSFGFTDDGRIKWSSIHYSGFCETDSGFTPTYYVSSGQTPQICVTGLTSDFNITIVFERNKTLTGCDLSNSGGWNDLITGRTLVNDVLDVMTGATEEYTYVEVLNQRWLSERDSRLGKLKIYLNGMLVYKTTEFEEIVPSSRGVQPFIQSWGGGTELMNGIHSGVSLFNIKSFKYYEEPLNFVNIRHNFLTRICDFDFEICNSCFNGTQNIYYSQKLKCIDNTDTEDFLLNEDETYIMLEDGYFIVL